MTIEQLEKAMDDAVGTYGVIGIIKEYIDFRKCVERWLTAPWDFIELEDDLNEITKA